MENIADGNPYKLTVEEELAALRTAFRNTSDWGKIETSVIDRLLTFA